MLVLLVGMRSNDENNSLESASGLRCQPSGFMQSKDSFLGNVESNVEGIFYAGAVTAPKNIGESLNEGTAAALAAAKWICKE
jgi:heterodisulfide reductase subunit A